MKTETYGNLSARFAIAIPKEIRKVLPLQPHQRMKIAINAQGKIELEPVLTDKQIVGFLKGKKLRFDRDEMEEQRNAGKAERAK